MRLEPILLGKVRRIAKRRGTTLTHLIEQGLHLVVRLDVEERRAKVVDAEQV